jgi:hypothetical protein
MQGIDRAFSVHDREEDQIDELQASACFQEARRPSQAKVDGRLSSRLSQEKQAGRQVAGRTQEKRSPKYFTHG